MQNVHFTSCIHGVLKLHNITTWSKLPDIIERNVHVIKTNLRCGLGKAVDRISPAGNQAYDFIYII